MTLSMEPGSRNAVVGKLVPHGQAYRAVRTIWMRDPNSAVMGIHMLWL